MIGVDNDRAMIAAAGAHASDRVRFELADIATWNPVGAVDVIVANAAFQWVPGHRDRLADWIDLLNPGGALAFQVRGNLDNPHHKIIRALRTSARWRSVGRLAELPERTHDSFRATEYLDILVPIAETVDAWETTYVHILSGADPVLEWVKGTVRGDDSVADERFPNVRQ